MKKNNSSNPIATMSPLEVERLSLVQKYIETGEFTNGTEIGAALGVQRQAVYAYIGALQRLGHPIEWDSKKNCYFYKEKVAPIVPVPITESEVTTLHLLKSLSDVVRGTPMEKGFKSGLKKFFDSLSTDLSLKMRRLHDAISFHSTGETIVDQEFFNTLVQSIIHRDELTMGYQKAGPGEKPSHREIHVHQVVKVDSNWYFFAYIPAENKMKTFFISRRIQSLVRSGKKFRRQKFNVKEQLKTSFGIRTSDKLYKVRILCSPKIADYIREKIWPAQKDLIELPDGSVELHLEVSHLDEVKRFVVSWFGEATVLDPIELEEGVLVAGQKIAEAQMRRKEERLRQEQAAIGKVLNAEQGLSAPPAA